MQNRNMNITRNEKNKQVSNYLVLCSLTTADN